MLSLYFPHARRIPRSVTHGTTRMFALYRVHFTENNKKRAVLTAALYSIAPFTDNTVGNYLIMEFKSQKCAPFLCTVDTSTFDERVRVTRRDAPSSTVAHPKLLRPDQDAMSNLIKPPRVESSQSCTFFQHAGNGIVAHTWYYGTVPLDLVYSCSGISFVVPASAETPAL